MQIGKHTGRTSGPTRVIRKLSPASPRPVPITSVMSNVPVPVSSPPSLTPHGCLSVIHSHACRDPSVPHNPTQPNRTCTICFMCYLFHEWWPLTQPTATDGSLQAVLCSVVAEADCFAELLPPARLVHHATLKKCTHSHSVHRSVLPSICCLLYTSPSPRDQRGSRMPSSA